MELSTVIINYQTPDLLETAVRSFKKYYPQQLLYIIDNGSKDDSKDIINDLVGEYEQIESVYLAENIYHGPAMDYAIQQLIKTKFVFFLDSDTETKKDGFIEKMVAILKEDEQVYGVGQIQKVNKRGYKSEVGYDIILTPYMMLKTNTYKSLTPFIHHGQPTLMNFKRAIEEGFKLVDFPITNYIDHKWRGTSDRFGYGLGLKGKIDYVLNKLGL